MITQVAENLYRGARIKASDIKELIRLRINTIINLEEATESSIMDDKMICDAIGALFINWSMSEFKRPSSSFLRWMVKFIQDSLNARKIIYIHCNHGQDRTGYVIAAYRMLVQDWSFQEAFDECKRLGHQWLWYFWWKKSLKGLESK